MMVKQEGNEMREQGREYQGVRLDIPDRRHRKCEDPEAEAHQGTMKADTTMQATHYTRLALTKVCSSGAGLYLPGGNSISGIVLSLLFNSCHLFCKEKVSTE